MAKSTKGQSRGKAKRKASKAKDLAVGMGKARTVKGGAFESSLTGPGKGSSLNSQKIYRNTI